MISYYRNLQTLEIVGVIRGKVSAFQRIIRGGGQTLGCTVYNPVRVFIAWSELKSSLRRKLFDAQPTVMKVIIAAKGGRTKY